MILRNVSFALREGDFEGRCALISAVLLSLSIHISALNPAVSTVVIVLTGFVSKGNNFRLISGFLPFFILILLSGILFSFKYSLISALAFAGIISTGSVVYSSKISEICGALIYFRVPERFVSLVYLALSIMPVLVNDLREIIFAMNERGFKKYEKVLKAFVSTAILRAISLSESLYSKNYRGKAVYQIRSPGRTDIILLSVSFLLFLSTVLSALLHLQF